MTGADIYMKTCKEKALEWNVSPRSVNDMDSIVCGNAGRTKSQMDACLTDQERRVYTYYKKMRELNAA